VSIDTLIVAYTKSYNY